MPLGGLKFKRAYYSGEAGRGGHSGQEHPLPQPPADGRGPALESHMGQREPKSQECEQMQNVTTSPHFLSGAPPAPPPAHNHTPFLRLVDLWLLEHTSLPFQELLPP